MSLANFRKDISIEVYNLAGPEGAGLQRLPLLGVGVPGAAAARRGRQRRDDQHHQAGERGLGSRHLGDRDSRRPRRPAGGQCSRAGTGTRPGRLHREFELSALTGREEEHAGPGRTRAARHAGHGGAQPLRAPAWRDQPGPAGRDAPAAGGGPAVPAAAGARRPPSATRCMPIWSARGRTAVRRCRSTSRSSDVPVEEPPYRAPLHTMTLSDEAIADGTDLGGDGEVCFRLPNGVDQEELSDLLALNEAEALTGLLCRCVQRLGPHRPPDREQVSRAVGAGPGRDRGADAAGGAEGGAVHGRRRAPAAAVPSSCRSTSSGSSSANCAPTASCSTRKCTIWRSTTTGASTRSWA